MTAEPSASSDRLQTWKVSAEGDGKRLDVFLAEQIPSVSRAHIRRGIDDGSAQVDGQLRKASYKLAKGQQIWFSLPEPPADGPMPEPLPVSVLHEDDAIAVVEKPAGMVVHPAKGHWSGTLASALVHYFQQLSKLGGPSRPGIVHRLDRDTSGVLVVAKTDQAHARLSEQFKARTVEKEYVAIVLGHLDRDRDQINHPIGDHPSQRDRKALRADHPSSREAETFYEVEQRFPGLALLHAYPKTGRTHQIRLHLAHIGCPVLCDKLYGGRSQLTAGELRTICRRKEFAPKLPDETVLLDRQALHAHTLRFIHPTTNTPMEFVSPLPSDLERLLSILRSSITRK